VLFGAGDGGVTDTELFDPDTNTFVAAGKLTQGRSKLTAHALPDGRAIVIGGSSKSAGAINDPLDSIELFDPKTNTWSTVPYKLSKGRTWHASALVRDGTILAMGGYVTPLKCDSLDDTVDQIDPVKGTVKPFAVLPNKNTEWEAVTLLDGSVLGVGGGACGTSSALPDLDFLPGKPGPM
ncbi:MAG: kelch repeat-containing protein, partial [Polyangiales bacterium]